MSSLSSDWLTPCLHLIGLNVFLAVEISMNVLKQTTVAFTAAQISQEDTFVNVQWIHYGILSGYFTKTAPSSGHFCPDSVSFCVWVDLVKSKSQSCEIETEDACNSNGNPCIKGKCIPIGKNNYRCECIDGYEGEKVCKHVCRNKATCGTGPKSGICVEAEDTYLCICNSEGKYYIIIM